MLFLAPVGAEELFPEPYSEAAEAAGPALFPEPYSEAAKAAGPALFPEPPELRPDVDFWVSIFTQYRSDQGVLHDNRQLGVVYGQIDVPEGQSRRARNRRVSERRKQLQAVLRSLAAGKRDGLGDEEARVLALWPADVSNKTLKAAVGRIRFQQGLSDRFRAGLVRSGRWRGFIETEFAALGVPVEIAALPHVESSYNPDARSHVGASGIWQFTRSTGRRFMRVDHVVDQRNDPFAATRSAGKLLAYNYSITGNWPMAITAYNHGLAGVRRAMRKYGDTAYVDILRNYDGRTFGFASRNFYVAFLAAKKVDQNAQKYFPDVTSQQPTKYAQSVLPSYIAVSNLSKALGVTPTDLAKHNPALQATVWKGSKYLPKGFEVRLPTALLEDSIDTLIATVPDSAWAAKQLADMFHTVARGDTLSQIAQTYDTRVSTLVALNGLSSRNRIRSGQRLRLPAAGPAPPVVVAAAETTEATVAVDSVIAATEPTPTAGLVDSDIAAAEEEIPAEIEEMAPAVMADAAPPASSAQTALLSDPSDYSVSGKNSIEVQSLETLGHYADWLGIRTQRLRDINGLAFRTPVDVGQRIKLEISDIDIAAFEGRRIAYHRRQQDAYFRQHVITGITEHTIKRGESIWILSLRQYGVPLWLFRQYNPELNLQRVRPGTQVQFPVLAESDAG